MSSNLSIYEVLPVELIARIIKYTDSDLKWLMKLELVCKWFHKYTKQPYFWKLIGINELCLTSSNNKLSVHHPFITINGNVFDCEPQQPLEFLLRRIAFSSLTYALDERNSKMLCHLVNKHSEAFKLKHLHLRTNQYKVAHVAEFVNTLNKLELHLQLEEIAFIRCQTKPIRSKVDLSESELSSLSSLSHIISSSPRLRQVRLSFPNSPLDNGLCAGIEGKHRIHMLCLENLLGLEVPKVVQLCHSLPNLRALQVLRCDNFCAMRLSDELGEECRAGIKHLALSFSHHSSTALAYDLSNRYCNLENCMLDFFDVGGYKDVEIKNLVNLLLESHSRRQGSFPRLNLLIVSTCYEKEGKRLIEFILQQSNLINLNVDFGHVKGYCRLEMAKLIDTVAYFGVYLLRFDIGYSKSAPYTLKCELLDENLGLEVQNEASGSKENVKLMF